MTSDAQGLAEVVEQLTEIETVGRERLASPSPTSRVDRSAAGRRAEPDGPPRRVPQRARDSVRGESGFGTGVTQNFYSSVAAELLRAKTNAALPVWLADAADAGGADATASSRTAARSRPLAADAAPETVAAVCAYFRFSGG